MWWIRLFALDYAQRAFPPVLLHAPSRVLCFHESSHIHPCSAWAQHLFLPDKPLFLTAQFGFTGTPSLSSNLITVLHLWRRGKAVSPLLRAKVHLCASLQTPYLHRRTGGPALWELLLIHFVNHSSSLTSLELYRTSYIYIYIYTHTYIQVAASESREWEMWPLLGTYSNGERWRDYSFGLDLQRGGSREDIVWAAGVLAFLAWAWSSF